MINYKTSERQFENTLTQGKLIFFFALVVRGAATEWFRYPIESTTPKSGR